MTLTSARPAPDAPRHDPALHLLAHFLERVTDPPAAAALARTLIDRRHDLAGVCGHAAEDAWTHGLEGAVVAELGRLQAFAEALSRPVHVDRQVLSSWTALTNYLTTTLVGLPREQARVLYLDRRNRLLADDWVADGTLDHAPLYPREVVVGALKRSASAVILLHNHPSGDPTPSAGDVELTRRVVEAARAVGVVVHDHVVVARGGVVSLRQRGLL